MKSYFAILPFIVLVACQPKQDRGEQAEEAYSFYVGTYTGTGSEGIYKFLMKEDGSLEKTRLAAKSDNPSFLARTADGKYLLAVNELSDENGEGSVESYLIRGDSLVFLSRSSSGGAHPCYISVNKEGYVLAANYSGGNVGLLKLGDDGLLSGLLDLQKHSGSGTTDRQKGPHAHSAWFGPDNNNIISVDLGTNELWFSRLEIQRQKLIPSYPHKLQMEQGAGPRHLAFHPDQKWIYVVNELNSTVTLVRNDSLGQYHKASSVSTLPRDYSETNYCADIHVSPDGKFVYASNRGHNSIAIFKVIPESGKLMHAGYQEVHGDWPRNFSLSPDGKYLLVANQKSNNIVSFRRDPETGQLEFIDEIEAPAPVCVLF